MVRQFMARQLWAAAAVAFSSILLTPAAFAGVIAVGVGAIGAGSTLTTFDGQVDGAEANGAVVDGMTFQYSLGNGQLVFDGGPGITNNVSPLNIVSTGNASGVLTILLPSLSDAFGYGFASLTGPAASTTAMSLFNGATLVGSLSFDGALDPVFIGGFSGIQSTLGFDRVDVTFNSTTAFALDNIRTSSIRASAVPEPTTLALLGLGLAGLGFSRRKKAYPSSTDTDAASAGFSKCLI